MSDFSGYFQIGFTSLDGVTVPQIAWGPNPPTQYRIASAEALGQIPINLFTRSEDEAGGKRPPASIAREGALVVARFVGLVPSLAAEIGVWPQNGSFATQRQALTSELTVRLWTFPGDSIWVFDPAGNTRGRIDFFVRSLNFKDLESLLSLPGSQRDLQNSRIFELTNEPALPLPTTPRTIYVVSPPNATHTYALPAPAQIAGFDLVVVNVSPFACDLASPTNFQGQVGVNTYTLGARTTAELTSYGSSYTELRLGSDRTFSINAPIAFQPWRGTLRPRFLGANAYSLPSASSVAADSVMVAFNAAAVPITIDPIAGESINGQPNLLIPPDTARIIMPNTPNSWTSD